MVFQSNLSKLRKINKSLKINDFIITSKDQSKQFKSKNEVFIFNKLDKFFKNFISNKVDIKKTAFISLGSRFIFKKKDIDFFNNNLLNFHCSRLPYDSGVEVSPGK